VRARSCTYAVPYAEYPPAECVTDCVLQLDSLAITPVAQFGGVPCCCSHCCCVVPESMSLLREALVLPTVKIPIAAPANPQQQLRISLSDSSKRRLASWQAAGPPPQCTMHQQGGQHKQLQPSDGSCSDGDQTGCCLVFQQQVRGPAGQLQAQVGPDSVQLQAQELWAALPGPGTFFIKVGTTGPRSCAAHQRHASRLRWRAEWLAGRGMHTGPWALSEKSV
jgi:hypothetical protein